MQNIPEKLSDGYDFIEEACGYSEPLIYEEHNEVTLSEAEETEHPFKIIGVLRGKFAPVGGFSRNNRYYPPDHWKTVLESAEIQRRLKGREMFGMIGHEDSRVSDTQIREGLVSHIVTKLDIKEDENGKPFLYGEMELLNTPSGKILKAMHEGGAGLYVSSRGAGKLLDTPGKPYKTVSPNFFLETWDVVCRPGFMEAKPVFEGVKEHVESVKESVPEEKEETTVNEAVVSTADLVAENNSNKPINEVEVLKEQVQKLATVLEKVVDSIYEDEEETKITEEQKGAILGLVGLLSESNIKDETLLEVLDTVYKNLKK